MVEREEPATSSLSLSFWLAFAPAWIYNARRALETSYYFLISQTNISSRFMIITRPCSSARVKMPALFTRSSSAPSCILSFYCRSARVQLISHAADQRRDSPNHSARWFNRFLVWRARTAYIRLSRSMRQVKVTRAFQLISGFYFCRLLILQQQEFWKK